MPESWDDIIAEVGRRTVHVACLPHNATLDQLVKRFSDFGTVNQVRLLKHSSETPEHRVFRGCCLIEMGTEEEAKAVLSTPVEYEDCPVRIQTKAQYDEAVKKVGFKISLPSLLCFGLFG
jgi:lupus La protein